jgi:hypothetical protein
MFLGEESMKAVNTRGNSRPDFAPRLRRNAVAAASLLALGGMLGSVAQAQTGSYTLNFASPSPVPLANQPTQTNYIQHVLIGQFNGLDLVSATVPTNTIGQNAPGVVTNNSITATAMGNLFQPGAPGTVLDLGGLVSGSGGLISTVAQVQSVGTVTSSVPAGSSIALTDSSGVAAPMTLTGNTISANTTLDQSTTTVTGTVPNGFSSAQAGTITAHLDGTQIKSDTTATVDVETSQVSLNSGFNAGSNAAVAGSTIMVDVSGLTGNESAAITAGKNAISANYAGNQSSNVVEALDGSIKFQGSVAVTNIQANLEALAAPLVPVPTASVAGSSITADYSNGGAGQTTLTTGLSMSNNSIAANSTGNAAGSVSPTGSIVAGNAIIFDQNVDVMGPGAGNGFTHLFNTSSTVDASTAADLALVNGQGNQNTSFISSVTDGGITVQGDDIASGGGISLTGNTVAANSTGNLAGNLIAAAGSTNFSATAAIGNSQRNSTVPITATNTDAAITVDVGTAGVTQSGTVTASSNTIGATATSNLSSSTISVNSDNITMRRPGNPSSTAVADIGANAGYGDTQTITGAGVANLQGTYGASTTIQSSVAGTVAVQFADQTASTPVPLSGMAATMDQNTIASTASGNVGTTDITLVGQVGNVQAALANTQVNRNNISASTTDSGVSITAAAVSGNTALTVSNSTIDASATGNDGTNTLSATFSNSLITGPSGPGGTNAVTSDGSSAVSNAALGIASAQKNEGGVTASNTTATSFAVVNVAGVTDSSLAVKDNTASASSTDNLVNNTISLDVGNLSAQATGTYTQLAGISNLQGNSTTAGGAAPASNATVGGSAPGGLLIGVQYGGNLSGSAPGAISLTSKDNTVASSATGNDAINTVLATGGNVLSTSSVGGTGVITSSGGVTSIQNEFSLLNRQTDSAVSRTATTQNVVVGIDGPAVANTVNGSNLTVEGNAVTATATNNTASNLIGLTGFTNLTSGASLLNTQSSATPVDAEITNSIVRLGVQDATIGGTSNLIVGGSNAANKIDGSATGSVASNILLASATNLAGSATIGGNGGSSFDTGSLALTVNADYGVANVQSQTGTVTSNVDGSVTLSGAGSAITGGSATVSGNEIKSIAQSTSADNELLLTGVTNVVGDPTNVSNLTGAVASIQNSTGAVSAAMTTSTGLSFAMTLATSNNTPLIVSGNTLLVSAGQNEVKNLVLVSSTNLSGGSQGTNLTSFTPGGSASVGTDFSILNVQTGSGDVTANAQPQTLGIQIDSITGGTASVSGNTITAKAGVNSATNALVLNSGSTLNATGAINNLQTTSGSSTVSSTIGDLLTPVFVGIGPNTGGVTSLTSTSATVSDNILRAQAGGNTASNQLSATATSSIGGSATTPTFAILNNQTNAAAIQSTVSSVTIGLNLSGVGGGMTSTNAAVLGNQVIASSYGNNASNLLTLTSTSGANMASAGISSFQSNTANISSTISNVTIGINATSASGGAAVTSGNAITAFAVGNSATSSITSK